MPTAQSSSSSSHVWTSTGGVWSRRSRAGGAELLPLAARARLERGLGTLAFLPRVVLAVVVARGAGGARVGVEQEAAGALVEERELLVLLPPVEQPLALLGRGLVVGLRAEVLEDRVVVGEGEDSLREEDARGLVVRARGGEGREARDQGALLGDRG